MEEESLENDSVAKLMNENFVNIKVDREERPDIDKIYMNAVELITRSGDWPLNCITLLMEDPFLVVPILRKHNKRQTSIN